MSLKKWFGEEWVNIAKKKKGGGHPACGTGRKKGSRTTAKCVPKKVANRLSEKEKKKLVARKRKAERTKPSRSSGGGARKPKVGSNKIKGKSVLRRK
jgi:hypothetical protein|tara:strand:+ start:410 stop:700 length:291 start_codon:yes stop_codon:yes gene_type:complete